MRRLFAQSFNRLPERVRSAALIPPRLFGRSWRDQIGAFAITNKQFGTRSAAWIPAAHKETADATATTTAVDTGIVGLKWARVKIRVKTFGTLVAADVFRATLQVGTGAAITAPENIAQASVTVETGDTSLMIELIGSSENGFQSWKVIFTTSSSHTFTADVLFDAA